jgi:hypothetical protein
MNDTELDITIELDGTVYELTVHVEWYQDDGSLHDVHIVDGGEWYPAGTWLPLLQSQCDTLEGKHYDAIRSATFHALHDRDERAAMARAGRSRY